jgi:hypothetical protein
MQQHGMHWHTNWGNAAVSIGEQLPDDGLVRPNMLQLNVNLMTFQNKGEIVNGLFCIRDGNDWTSDTSMQQDVEIQYITTEKCLSSSNITICRNEFISRYKLLRLNLQNKDIYFFLVY